MARDLAPEVLVLNLHIVLKLHIKTVSHILGKGVIPFTFRVWIIQPLLARLTICNHIPATIMGTFSVQMVVREGFHCTLCNREGLTWKNTHNGTGHVCGVKSILLLFSILSWCK